MMEDEILWLSNYHFNYNSRASRDGVEARQGVQRFVPWLIAVKSLIQPPGFRR
jgi:hypothetical protein